MADCDEVPGGSGSSGGGSSGDGDSGGGGGDGGVRGRIHDAGRAQLFRRTLAVYSATTASRRGVRDRVPRPRSSSVGHHHRAIAADAGVGGSSSRTSSSSVVVGSGGGARGGGGHPPRPRTSSVTRHHRATIANSGTSSSSSLTGSNRVSAGSFNGNGRLWGTVGGGAVDESLLLDEAGGSDNESWDDGYQRVRSVPSLSASGTGDWGWASVRAPKSLGASRREREIAASEVMLRSLRMIENMSGLEPDSGANGVPRP
ncbi:hypothetical protein MMPV_006664 [Pyropia vietnamensis]